MSVALYSKRDLANVIKNLEMGKCPGLFGCALNASRASLIAQLVKNPPAMQKTPVQFLGQVNPLEKG